MNHYLISFPSAAMKLTEEEFEAAGRDSRAVVQAAKDAGVYIFGGGINDQIEPVLVGADSSVTAGGYTGGPQIDGGFMVLRVESRDEALEWAARTAAACRCAQEVREFFYDPES